MIRRDDDIQVGYELVVKVRPGAEPPSTSPKEMVLSKAVPQFLIQALPDQTFSRMFSGSTLDISPPIGSRRSRASSQRQLATLEMSRFYGVKGDRAQLEEASERIRATGQCESIVVRPLPTPPALPAALTSPDLSARQGYVDSVTRGGIDAQYAWSKGILGQGIRVTDVEGDWNLTHEDLPLISRIGSGAYSDHNVWWNHGTAVLGVMASQNNGLGTTGIAPGALYSTSSIFDAASPGDAILAAANRLVPGDVIVLEVQLDFRAPEWWEDYFIPIRHATQNGILVVEAAGNGNTDLDDPSFDTGGGTVGKWKNPYRRDPAYDSGSIVVGAGAPPSGNFGIDRSRLDFSNYGSMVDAQGWGEEVMTLGYGDVFGTVDDSLYTAVFSGTSSATPIVAGALVLVQSYLKGRGVAPLTYAEARCILRSTGTPQAGNIGERVGSRPNLRQILSQAAVLRGITGP
jgi:Subtilase family